VAILFPENYSKHPLNYHRRFYFIYIEKEDGSGVRPVASKDTLAKFVGLLMDNDKSNIINLSEPINFSYSKSEIEKQFTF
jgi:hypothetical protein